MQRAASPGQRDVTIRRVKARPRCPMHPITLGAAPLTAGRVRKHACELPN